MDTPLVNIVKGLPPEVYPDEYVAVDLEIYGIPSGKLHRPVGEFACASVCLGRELGHEHIPTVYQFYDPLDIPKMLKRIERGKHVYQNFKFDCRQMRRWATIEPRRIWDTLIIEQGLWGGYYSSFSLDALVARYLHEYLPKETREEFQTAREMTPQMQEYAALDPWYTLRVAKAQMDYVKTEHESLDHYWLADHPALWAILDMPGVRMNVAGWHQLAGEFTAKAEAIQAQYPINLNSPVQVNKRLCELLRRRDPLKSTNEEALLEIKDKVQGARPELAAFIDDILEFRGAKRMSSTYGDNWLEKHIEGDLVFADWKPVQALTGRMACGEPNLQNVPSREYPIFRSLFVATRGHCIVVGDVAQQEPRILARLSGDPHLTTALRNGQSPHILVGQRVFGDPNFSKKDPRYVVAKQLNLGLSYGMTEYGLSVKAGIPVEEARVHLEAYFKAFPGIKSYIEEYRRKAFAQGYVRTLLGRRSYINPYVKKAENNAINSPIQGTGGDQMKIAMGFLHRESKTAGIPFRLSMVVHDEMVGDVPEEHTNTYIELVKAAWDEAGKRTLGDVIPMVVEIETGKDWACKNG